MAKYFTTEEKFECYLCEIRATRRELYCSDHNLVCPNCKNHSFKKIQGCEAHELRGSTPITGILTLHHMRKGVLTLPPITVEEEIHDFDICEECGHYMLIWRTRLYDPAERHGCRRPYKMYGCDVLEKGSSLIVLKDTEISTNLYRTSTMHWDYFL
jgi:hypothetical protein